MDRRDNGRSMGLIALLLGLGRRVLGASGLGHGNAVRTAGKLKKRCKMRQAMHDRNIVRSGADIRRGYAATSKGKS